MGRNDRFDLNVFCFIDTSVLDVLRRQVEFTQYASDAHQALLTKHRLVGSMSRKGKCWDNAVMERFFLNLKMERVCQRYCGQSS